MIVKMAAPTASPTASVKVEGSIVKPKLKKKMAPKKSLKGTTRRSILCRCSVSEYTNPKSNAPIASATCKVSEKPAIKKREAKIIITKTSSDWILINLEINEEPFLAITRNKII